MFYTNYMKEDDIRAYVIKRMAQSAKVTDVALEVTDKAHLYYDDALKIVEEIAEESVHEVARKHTPLFFAMSVIMLALGLGLTLAALLQVGGLLYGTSNISPFGALNAANAIIYMTNLGPFFAGQLILGLGMLIGGIIGMTRLWSEIFYRDS